MAGLCEGCNESAGSLKAILIHGRGHRRKDDAQETCPYALCDDSADNHCGILRSQRLEEIWAQVVPGVSPRTIRNHLLAAELPSRGFMLRLPLTPRHRQARLLLCRDRVD
ncbi:hypothetical protein ANN_23089 [Periplaneta americana]|uniref:Uncharacterized protein n=1 Tax=Periplaneta americana TaxID=6978 RepID=A0ABQ8SLJ6_PERAM|nr:hypothetical protein ANN_23089 [Periplaneta americana]